jgi:hypothetical protein
MAGNYSCVAGIVLVRIYVDSDYGVAVQCCQRMVIFIYLTGAYCLMQTKNFSS